MPWLSHAKTFALDILFPLSCIPCGREGTILCDPCRAALPFALPVCIRCKALAPGRGRLRAGHTCGPCRRDTPIRQFLSPFSYRDPRAASLIHGLKYSRVRALAPVLARLIREHAARFSFDLPPRAVFVPVPLHPRRERVRGFNQSELLASALGQEFSRQVKPVLARIRHTRPQVTLTGGERRTNVAGAFEAVGITRADIAILVDDVTTTGATIDEAARTLKKAGAKTVWAVTVAH